MKLIQCRFSSGQRVPLLVQTGDAAPWPVLVPFIYVQLKLRYQVKLAREGSKAFNIDVECPAAFASKRAPTMVLYKVLQLG